MSNTKLVSISNANTSTTALITTQDGRQIQVNGDRTPEALSVPAFYSGVRFIAETLAGLPKYVVQRKGKVRKRIDHYVTPIMAEFPNELVNAFYLWETGIGHAVMYGNGYIWIERGLNGKLVGMHNLHSFMVVPFRHNNKQYYALRDANGSLLKDKDGKPVLPLPAKDVIHIRNFSEDGESGINVVWKLQRTLGIASNFDEFVSRYFEHGPMVNIVIEATGELDKADIDTLKYGITQNHRGLGNAHEAMVVANANVKSLSAPLQEWALDILKNATVEDISRLLRIPPHTLYALARGTWANVESMGIELRNYSFNSWVLKVELESKRKLLSAQDIADGYYIRWDLDGLERGDRKSRTESAVLEINNRMLSPNEWRTENDREPYEGGDEFYGAVNVAPIAPDTDPEEQGETSPEPAAIDPELAQPSPEAEQAEEATEDAATEAIEDAVDTTPHDAVTVVTPVATAKQSLSEKFGHFLQDAAKRVQTKQFKAFERSARKDGEQFQAWLNRFAGEQGIYLAETLNPFLETVVEDKTVVAFRLQEIVEEYTNEVVRHQAEADPYRVVANMLAKLEVTNGAH